MRRIHDVHFDVPIRGSQFVHDSSRECIDVQTTSSASSFVVDIIVWLDDVIPFRPIRCRGGTQTVVNRSTQGTEFLRYGLDRVVRHAVRVIRAFEGRIAYHDEVHVFRKPRDGRHDILEPLHLHSFSSSSSLESTGRGTDAGEESSDARALRVRSKRDGAVREHQGALTDLLVTRLYETRNVRDEMFDDERSGDRFHEALFYVRGADIRTFERGR